MSKRFVLSFVSFLIICLTLVPAEAQQTGFTYQGKLTDSGTPANGNYDLQFALFDSPAGSSQIGVTQTIPSVSVSGGVFTVKLDFGANAFAGPARFLEISTRPAATGAFTLLSPRQPITATPYAVRSLTTATADTATNAQQLGGVAASQFVKTDDTRMSDPRDPKEGSSNYIQNTTSQQPSTNFNISGNGVAGGTLSGTALNATTQYNIGGQRVLGVQINNQNTYLGVGAGIQQTIATQNSFFGAAAGLKNTSGSYNSFFGNAAGLNNTTGYGNAFFGIEAGKANTTGTNNVLVGDRAGVSITTGSYNTVIGDGAGFSVTTGDSNTFIGVDADGAAGITNATAIGASAVVNQSNSMVLGSNVNVGIGTSTPTSAVADSRALDIEGSSAVLRLGTPTDKWEWQATTINGNSSVLNLSNVTNGRTPMTILPDGKIGLGTTRPKSLLPNATTLAMRGLDSVLRLESDNGNTAWEWQSTALNGIAALNLVANNLTDANFIRNPLTVLANGNVGIGLTNPGAKLEVNGNFRLDVLGSGGSTQLCRNALAEVAVCSSSLRYKTDLRPFTRGLDVIKGLRPLTFKWKADQALDLGFGAEDVAAVEPLLVTHNEKGQVEGVKYDRLSAVFINAFKEQQAQIERQQAEAKSQRDQIALLQSANDSLNARLRIIEKALQKHPPIRRRP
jgi:hypothetical protein